MEIVRRNRENIFDMAGIEKRFCEDCKKREEIYYHFTQAVALFEMFFFKRPISEYVEVGNEMLQKASTEVERLQKKGNKKCRRGIIACNRV